MLRYTAFSTAFSIPAPFLPHISSVVLAAAEMNINTLTYLPPCDISISFMDMAAHKATRSNQSANQVSNAAFCSVLFILNPRLSGVRKSVRFDRVHAEGRMRSFGQSGFVVGRFMDQ